MPIVVRRQSTGVTYTVGFGFIRFHQDDRDRGLALYSTHGGVINEADVIGFGDADFGTMLLDWGLPEVAWSPGFNLLPGRGNGFYSAPWRGGANADGGPAAPAVTVAAPTIDYDKLATALAAKLPKYPTKLEGTLA